MHELRAGGMPRQHDAGQGGQALAVVQAAQQVVEHLERTYRRGPARRLDAVFAVFPTGLAPGRHAAEARVDRSRKARRQDQRVACPAGVAGHQGGGGFVIVVGIALDAVDDDEHLLDGAQIVLGQVAVGVDRHLVPVPGLAELDRLPAQGRRALGRGLGFIVVVGIGQRCLGVRGQGRQHGRHGQWRRQAARYAQRAGTPCLGRSGCRRAAHGAAAVQQLSCPSSCFNAGRSRMRTSRWLILIRPSRAKRENSRLTVSSVRPR
ncbi:hypothetical protein D3C86_347400 [compost metagenome]